MKQRQMLSDCVRSLKEVRTQLHSELDPSVTARLDAVVMKLEFCLQEGATSPQLVQATLDEGLKTIALVIESVVGIAELVAILLQ